MTITDLFTNVYGNTANITMSEFLLCLITAMFLGGAITNILMHKSNCSKSFAITVALLPMTVCIIVLLVSDNFGAGLAIAGAFTLIRFKSAAGSAKEITAILTAVAVGIACGTGYIAIAIVFAACDVALFCLYSRLHIWENFKDNLRYVFTVSLKYKNDTDDALAQVETLVKLYAVNLKQVSIEVGSSKEGKRRLKATYDIKLKSAQAAKDLTEMLKHSDIKAEFTLSDAQKPKIKRL